MPEYDSFERKRGPRVSIQPNFIADGVDIFMVFDYGGNIKILRFGPDHVMTLEDHEPPTTDKPSMTINNEMAQELCKALMYHFRLASLSSDLEDLLAERKRVDKLTDAIIDVAKEALYIDQQ